MAILLVITFAVIIAYIVYQYRRNHSTITEVKEENRLNNELGNPRTHIYDNPDKNRHEEEENEQSTYTALKKFGEREDNHVYGHLNQVPHIYANSDETGI